MENWRRQKWDNQKRSYNKRPPQGIWQPTVPSWEKQFCKEIGSMDWETLLQIKKFIHIYENVINWDDSAVEETFHNEKKRFLAKIQGLPCDIPLPDPDIYIDKIDWDNTKIDPKLLSDLENKLVISSTEDNHEPIIIFGDAILPKPPPTGWGENEDHYIVPNNNPSFNNAPHGWGDGGQNFEVPNNNSSFNNGPPGWGYYPSDSWGSWNYNTNYVPTGWGDYFNGGFGGWNCNSNYEAGPAYETAYWGPPNDNNGGRYISRDGFSRVRGNDRYRPRNNGGGHRGAYGGEGRRRHHRGWDIFTPTGQKWDP